MSTIPTPWLHPKTGVYYFRRGIPKLLRSTFGQWEIKKSLRTKTLAEAKSRFAQEYLKSEELLTKAREGNYTPQTKHTPNYTHDQITRSHKTTASSTSIGETFQQYSANQLANNENHKGKTQKRLDDYRSSMDRFIEIIGNKKIEQITRQDMVDYKNTLLKLPKRPSKRLKIRTIQEQMHLATQDSLPLLSPTTVKNKIMAISSILEFAKDCGHIASNPAHNMKLKRPQKAHTHFSKSYSEQELTTLFNTSIFTQNEMPTNKYGIAPYWVPLIAYYTGARAEEICQLYVKQIKSHNQIWYFEITEEEHDQSIKNASSERVIPVHNDLIKLGLLDYIKTLHPNRRLFPKLTPNRNGEYRYNFSRWWSHYIKQIFGEQFDKQPLHAFRHTFKTFCREAGLAEEDHDRLTGHAGNSIGRSYGTAPLAHLNKELQKIASIPNMHKLLNDKYSANAV